MNELALVKTEETTTTEIAVLKPFELQLADIQKANAEFVFDYTDPKQNEAARSHIYKLRQTKAAIEKAAKAEREESIRHQKAVIAEEKRLVAVVVEMIEHHDKPLKEFEEKEKLRVDGLLARINAMEITTELMLTLGSADLKTRRDEISAVNPDDFAEFKSQAFSQRIVAIEKLNDAIAAAEKREAEAAELQRLREEAEARRIADEEAARKAEEERLAKERAEQEERDRVEREAAEKRRQEEEAERIRRAQNEAAIAERQRAEKEAAEREQKLKDEKEAAERAAREAEEKAKRDAAEAEDRRQREAKEAEERQAAAVQDEKDRQAREQAAKEAEEARKAADREHRGKIHTAIVRGIMQADPTVTEEQAKKIVIGICGDVIPELKIIY